MVKNLSPFPYLPGLSRVGWRGWLQHCLWPHRGNSRPERARVWVTVADHFEPVWQHPTHAAARSRVDLWRKKWPVIAESCRDSTGRPARYTFFSPAEAYTPDLLEPLCEMSRGGLADVEVHLHHGGETRQQIADLIGGFVEVLQQRHGVGRKHRGRNAFGFIHGNWALDNSLPSGEHCGLNDELILLRELGCYADFTMPSGESPTQARTVNQIYWATDDPLQPKSYDRGTPLRAGQPGAGDLLMIPGPFGVRSSKEWMASAGGPPGLRQLRHLYMLALETGELASYDRVLPERIQRWLDLAPRINNNIFLKLFAHGAQERHSAYLLEGGLEATYSLLAAECSRLGWEYHFCTAWEMFQAVQAAAGITSH